MARPSARLSLVNATLRFGLKPLLSALHRPDLKAAEAAKLLSYLGRAPRGVAEAGFSLPGPGGEISIRSFDPPNANPSQAILFFHGGGYIACDTRLYRGLLGELALRSGHRVIAPDYRLAPEHPFPAAFEDAQAVWAELHDHLGYASHNLVLAGDSAGGGLALSLLAHALARGDRPAGVMAMSPWTDLTLSGASFRENAERDVIFPPSKAPDLVKTVAGGTDPADPRLSPLFANWVAPPPAYLGVSETELLRDDTLRLADRLRAAGGEVTVDLVPDAPHVLPLFYGVLPEADAMLSRSADFATGLFRSAPLTDDN